ncbi:MAG: AAA family ATPase [Fusobacteriaceae bacterium]
MLVEKLSIEGFKCFKNKTEIKFDKFNGFIGNNGTGKTSILEALIRLFGSNLNDRKIKNQDFFIPLGEVLEDKAEKN